MVYLGKQQVGINSQSGLVSEPLTVTENGVYTPPVGKAFAPVTVETLHGIPLISNHINPETEEWERPAEWPNVENIELANDFDGIYLTYDLTKTPGYGWIGVYVQTKINTIYTVERGHLENNEFVVDETHTVDWKQYFRQALDNTYGDIQLWRVSSTGQIQIFAFASNDGVNANCFIPTMQPCVEKYGQLNFLTSLQSSAAATYTSRTYSTIWVESDYVIVGKQSIVTNLEKAWDRSYNLQRLKVDDWDTTNWKVTSLYGTWWGCISLLKLDLSQWNTTSWVVTNLRDAWSKCSNLKELKISTWNTLNWKVANLAGVWQDCFSLISLDLSNWNVSNWEVTNLSSCWNGCCCLQKLDISTWNTSNWAITNLSLCWNNCYSLQELNLSNWNTLNWAVTTLQGCWTYCSSLQNLDLSGWNTLTWAVTTLSSCWLNCYCLQELDISTWNTSNWAVNSLQMCWSQCYSLQELNLSNWDTSNWAVTTLSSCWNGCYCLQKLDVSTWDTSNWIISTTSLSSAWQNCYCLERLDISAWDTSNWTITSLGYCWSNCRRLQVLDISAWDVSSWNLTTFSNPISGCYSLHTLKFPASMNINTLGLSIDATTFCLQTFNGIIGSGNMNYSNAYNLTRQSLLNIIDKLPQVTSTKTLALGQHNKNKLTAAEIAVATQKGWTVT